MGQVLAHTSLDRAIEILGATAQEVEEAEGVLQNGQWIDFDPREPIKPVE